MNMCWRFLKFLFIYQCDCYNGLSCVDAKDGDCDHCNGFHGWKMLEMSVTSGLYGACSIALSEAHFYCDIVSDFAHNSISTTVK